MPWTFGPLLITGRNDRAIPNVRRTQMEQGPDRRKRISTLDKHEVRGGFYLASSADVDAFWSFWDGEANHGASWFDMDIRTRSNFVTHEVRISDPDISKQGRGFLLTVMIEVRQRLNV